MLTTLLALLVSTAEVDTAITDIKTTSEQYHERCVEANFKDCNDIDDKKITN